MSLAVEALTLKACRTLSVLAIMTESGPAAATRPVFEATLNREAVGGGRASVGHGDGKSRTFDSPDSDWNPRALVRSISRVHYGRNVKQTHFC